MDSASAGRPFRYALAARMASDCTDKDIRELLSQLGYGRTAAATQSTERGEEEDFWVESAAEGGVAMLFVPAHVSPAPSVRPNSSVAWEAQGPANAEQIRAVYSLFAAADEDTIGELLREVKAIKEGEEIVLAILLEMRVGPPEPHLLSLHGLGRWSILSSKEYEVPLYAWASDTSSGQAPVSIKVDPAWILSSKDRGTVNKVAPVNSTLWNAEPSDPRVVFDDSAPTEKLQAAVAVYIPHCLTPTLLTGLRFTRKAWGILLDRAKKLRILET